MNKSWKLDIENLNHEFITKKMCLYYNNKVKKYVEMVIFNKCFNFIYLFVVLL